MEPDSRVTGDHDRNAGDAIGASGEPDFVRGHDPHDLGKAERHDREVVVPQAKGREAHQQAYEASGQHGCENADQDRRLLPCGEHRRSISADRKEPGKAEIDEPSQSPGQHKALRQQRIDRADDEHEQDIGQHVVSPPCYRGDLKAVSQVLQG
jgi:hypothetical protein